MVHTASQPQELPAGRTTATQSTHTGRRVIKVRKAPVQSARGCPASLSWSSLPHLPHHLPPHHLPSAPGSRDLPVAGHHILTHTTTRSDVSLLRGSGAAPQPGASVAVSPDHLAICLRTIPPHKGLPAGCPQSSKMRTTTTLTSPHTRRTPHTPPVPTARLPLLGERRGQKSPAPSTPQLCPHDCYTPLLITTTTLISSIMPLSSRALWSWTCTSNSSRAASQCPTP